jgi:hypothetical protein
MGTQKKIIYVNYKHFHYKGLKGTHACFDQQRLTYYMGTMA